MRKLPLVEPGQPIRADDENQVRRQVNRWVTGGFDTPMGIAIVPGEGGGAAGIAGAAFALITSKIGSGPPYIYAATAAEMDASGVWSAASGGVTYNNVHNMEEQGAGGQWVNPLNVGDVVLIYAAPGGSSAFVCVRSHYRGTY